MCINSRWLSRWLRVAGGASGRELACQCRRHKGRRFNPWVGKISWRRIWQPTPVFLPGESYRQRSLAGYSSWGLKELDLTISVGGGLPRWASGKEPTCQCRKCKRHGFDPWVRKIPWRKAQPLTPVFFPGESPWTEEPGGLQSMGCKESDNWSDLACIQSRI